MGHQCLDALDEKVSDLVSLRTCSVTAVPTGWMETDRKTPLTLLKSLMFP